ncbi:hypothetical protein AUC31_06030 [Planococcus rifietoensis]|uniref:Type 4 fimbrial biogenesis protein PilX N-terminal domain-containing protein n=1 Tax=Planococcus rifietoensis TaxID=200991 RepID=A0A0U2PA50_9BACL|nr:hypothetical protein [Planococcus rifietoensis]ALS74807.1 hypothetical protein AUC31_06030 [Planococcus rifietoensis]
MRQQVGDEKGYSLFITLLAIMLVGVLGLSLITMATNTMSFSQSERGNQSSFYIAEAGLTAKRAEIQLLVEQAFKKTHQQFEAISSPQDKAQFNFEQEYKDNVQGLLTPELNLVDSKNYESQQGNIPVSEAALSLVSTDPLVYNVESTGVVPIPSGRNQTKVLSQLLEIQLNVDQETVVEEINGEKIAKLKACFSLYTTEDLYHNTNSLKGPIYVNGTTYIQRGGAFIDGNLYSVGDVRITGGGSGINGDVYTSGKVIITQGGSKVNGKVFQNVDLSQVENECVQELPQLPDVATVFSAPTMSPLISADNQSGSNIVTNGVLSLKGNNNSTWTLSEDVYLKKLSIESGVNLTLDLKNQNRTIFVDDWDVKNGFIHLQNSANSKLRIVIKDKMTHSNGDLNVNGSPDNVEVFYAGATTPSLGGNSKYNATFHVKRADLTVTGSNGLMGDLIHYGTGSTITVSGHGDMGNKLILAPNSNFFLTGSGSILGNIIAKNFTASGAGSISPPSSDSGEWEYTEGQKEIIEYTSFEKDGSLIKATPISEE